MLTALSPAGNNDHDSRAVPYKIFVQNLLGTYVFIRFTCLHQMFPWGTLLREHLLRCFCWSSGCRIRSTPAFNRSDTSIDTLRYYCVDADPFLYFSLRTSLSLNREPHCSWLDTPTCLRHKPGIHPQFDWSVFDPAEIKCCYLDTASFPSTRLCSTIPPAASILRRDETRRQKNKKKAPPQILIFQASLVG